MKKSATKQGYRQYDRVRRHPKLVSKKLQAWLDEPLFVLGDVSLSRQDVVNLSDSPCTKAARTLAMRCAAMQIRSLDRLYDVGLAGLSRVTGIGERAEWMAALILYHFNYNVDRWITKAAVQKAHPGVQSTRSIITLVHSKTKKRKHA